ncbi:alpha-sarcoglycan [Triplophysa dalaica]|uniref:alpha-sarcoglycan n=1 Tax=Triplophysa dalaica TaxID=1582913 RepID=UPI0024DFF207|nr:alpha-sarcoglycan [Triplophysa dalaica]
MADKENWALAITVFLTSLLVGQADMFTEATVGKLFVYELQREGYQREFEPFHKVYDRDFNDPLVFKCNKERFPDLPRWLRFTQRDPYSNGFLYGTPLPEDQGRNIIQIFVSNRRSYDDVIKERLVINVVHAGRQHPYQAEFFLELRNIENVLPLDARDEIIKDTKTLWDTEVLEFVNITSALDRGGRVPLPLPGYFEGVYVKLGSDKSFSECMLKTVTPEHERQCAAGGKMPGECKICFNPINCITWCKTVLFDLSKPIPPARVPTVGSGILEWGGEFNPPDSPPERDFFPDYIITIIIPFIIAVILCLILAYVMCCRREGVVKRNTTTPDVQLYHHHTIQGNFNELRRMAGRDRSTMDRPRQCLQPLIMSEQTMAGR